MVTYSDEDRAQILEAARAALEATDATLATPRPELALPPAEDKLERWRREAREQEERSARERAAPRALTDWEAAQLQRNELAAMVDEQKDFFLRLLAELTAEIRHEFDQKVAALADELGQLRADRTLDRALAKGDVADLPPLTRKRA